MAIGDKPNQNLFGTDYNAEDEEEKKAQLAAQGAMMGATGGTQDSLLRSFEDSLLRGQSQNNPFGQAGIQAGQQFANNIRIGAEIPDLSSNVVAQVPGIQNIRNPGAFDPETGYLGNIKPGEPIMSTGTVERVTPNSLVVNKISDVVQGLRDTVGTESVSMEDYQARQATQAPSGVAALGATPSVTPPVERPTASAQEQPGAVVSPFLQSPDTPSGLGGPLLRGFEMVNDAARGPNAPMGQDATRAALGGMTLNEYLNAPAGTPGVSGLRTDPQGRMITPSAQPPVDSAIPSATTQPPVGALSSFEQDSLARQQRIGGTGSFEGDSQAMQDRLRANERQPGESQSDRDTRVAQSRTTGSQTQGMSFDDARRRAEGQLAARGVKNPSASQVNALARGIQAAEPERLAELETKRAINEARLKTAQATLDRPEFEGKVYTVNGVTFAQTSRGGAQVIDAGTETPQESTAQMKDFAFTLEQIDKAREAFAAGDTDKANDIITAAGIQKNGFDVTASEYFGGSAPSVNDSELTEQQEANITRQAFDTMEEAEAANLPEGTKITIGGRNATV